MMGPLIAAMTILKDAVGRKQTGFALEVIDYDLKAIVRDLGTDVQRMQQQMDHYRSIVSDCRKLTDDITLKMNDSNCSEEVWEEAVVDHYYTMVNRLGCSLEADMVRSLRELGE